MAPSLPPRPQQQALLEADIVPDEPPPAYEPTPSTQAEQTLEYGPTRPFQQPHPVYSPPPHPPPPTHPSLSPVSTGTPSTLGPPQFPFWNGSNLTPEQTGFVPDHLRPSHHASSPYPSFSSSTSHAPPPGPPPGHNPYAAPPSSSSAPHIPPLTGLPNPNILQEDRGNKYSPTVQPTPGQPLSRDGQLLVFPVGKSPCPKCSNTGYKPFDPYSGYRGDDPSHPCRKCWQKHGRPFSGALALSCSSLSLSEVPANYQKPLRLLQTPAPRPQVTFATGGMGRMPLQPGAIVVRPGDPRMGGVLCRRCGGDGLVMGFLLFDEVTCDVCGGAGRVFH
ncbi:hypothetical protein JCM8547_009271 [Rhodosporidiobolus lusitaniae]